LFSGGDTVFDIGLRGGGGDLLCSGIGADNFGEAARKIDRGLAIAARTVPDRGRGRNLCRQKIKQGRGIMRPVVGVALGDAGEVVVKQVRHGDLYLRQERENGEQISPRHFSRAAPSGFSHLAALG